MSLIDASKRYSVTTRQIFDLDFFFTFFGNAEFTINNIIDKTEVVCEKWNEKYSGRPEVNTKNDICFRLPKKYGKIIYYLIFVIKNKKIFNEYHFLFAARRGKVPHL
jgi:hypothetical protein